MLRAQVPDIARTDFSPSISVSTSSRARPSGLAGRAVDTAGVAHPSTEHLVAAAQPEHPSAASCVGHDVVVPTLRTQERKIAEGGFRAQQYHHIGVARQRRARAERTRSPPKAPFGADPCRPKLAILERVGATILTRSSRARGRIAPSRSRAAPSSGGRLRAASSHGMTPAAWPSPYGGRYPGPRRRTDRGSPRNLLMANPVIMAASSGSSTAFVPTTAAIDTAAIDVGEQADRNLRVARESHVRDVAVPQVGLRRAPCPFHDHQVAGPCQALEALHHRGEETIAARDVVRRPERRGGAPVHHDLRRPVGLGLEQHRVHVDRRRESGRTRLKRLCPGRSPRHRDTPRHCSTCSGA